MIFSPDPSFTYDERAVRVVFGEGALARLADEVDRLGVAHAFVVTTPGRAALVDDLRRLLGARLAGVFDGAVTHVPAAVAAEALRAARDVAADGCVAIGGGSAIGLGKAVALETGLPLLAVPTTYSGSEMTAIWGLTDAGRKTTGRDPRVAPGTVLYDPALTFSLPPAVSGPSGVNAMAHCVEALYAVDGNPVTSLLAEEGLRALAESLPRVVDDPGDRAARAGALYGAHLAGRALGNVSMALHHKLCHTLGGSFGLPHAPTHAVVLPYSAAYNREAAPDAMRRVARALGADDAVAGLFALNDRLGIPRSLEALGLHAADLGRAADLAVERPYPNPRPVTREDIHALLSDAWHGRRPPVA